jgi:hypothetical protein
MSTRRKKTTKLSAAPKKLGKAGSMKQAAAMMGVTVAVLRAAKNSGSPGFDDHHRVDCEAVEAWLAENDISAAAAGGKDAEQSKLLKLRAERIQFELDRDRGKFFPRDELLPVCEAVCQGARQVWAQIPTLAPQLVGRPVDVIQKMLTTAVDNGMAEMVKLLDL